MDLPFYNFRNAVVVELATMGAAVHTCSRNEVELGKCLKEWMESGFQVTGSVADLSKREDREKLIQQVSIVFDGKLNILVSFSQICLFGCAFGH